MPPFEQWLQQQGINPEDDSTREIMRGVYESTKRMVEEARRSAPDGQTPPPAPAGERGENAEQAEARRKAIFSAARAAGGTARPEARAALLELADELTGKREVKVEDAIRQLGEKAVELVQAGGGEPAPAGEQRAVVTEARVGDRDAVLSRSEILSAFTDRGNDRTAVRAAARSVVAHMQEGDEIDFRSILRDIQERDGQELRGRVRVHVEDGGAPTVRTVTASSANVAIQNVLTYLLNKTYAENPPKTDPLVTVVPSSAAEDTLPEVETENGVRRVKEGEPYPILSGSERDVKTGYFKFGAGVAQTRENSVFDRLGRVSVHLTSLARQLRNKRDAFRLARICDSTSFDGRYIARPGNDAGSAAFYSASEDNRGNVNLKASNGLSDETDIDNAVQILDGMKLLDGTYVMAELKVLLVDSSKKAGAWKIVNSLFSPSVAYDTGNFMAKNPYGPEGLLSEVPKIISHPLVGTYAGATTTWFAGDPSKQFYEKEVWPVEVVPKVVGGEMALRDIVGLWIGSFCADLVALSNMYFVKSTA